MVYDKDSERLRIIYQSGDIYDYLDVPEAIYEEMKSARSKGVYLNKQIKKNYRFLKIK